jgi:hypothetical protein
VGRVGKDNVAKQVRQGIAKLHGVPGSHGDRTILNNFKSLSINLPSSSGILGARCRHLAGRPRKPPRRDIGVG